MNAKEKEEEEEATEMRRSWKQYDVIDVTLFHRKLMAFHRKNPDRTVPSVLLPLEITPMPRHCAQIFLGHRLLKELCSD